MDNLALFLNSDNILFGIPGSKLATVMLIILITLICRRLFSHIIMSYLKKLASKSETTIDDSLVEIAEKPLSLLILLAGIILCRMILIPYINPEIDKTIYKLLQFFFVVIICWSVHQSAEIITTFFQKFTRRTKTELDDLLLPYVAKTIKIAAIIIILVKSAEVFLGMTAAALIGLLGGMGITLGLVFRDIIACWFGCSIIYIDNLFREGDWVQLNDGKLIDSTVEHIGVRSTIFRNFDNTVSIVPNSDISVAIIKNWSKMFKRRVKYSFKIDGISSQKMETVLSGIRNILEKNESIHQDFHMVNFRELEGNARNIRLYYFTKTTVWKDHELVREKINLDILKMFEDSGVERLAYTIVDLSDDRPHDFEVSRQQ
jgi:MscS family membrane protein